MNLNRKISMVTIILFILAMCNPIFADESTTHIDVSPHHLDIKKGDSKKIKAELWQDTSSRFSDTFIPWHMIYLFVYDENGIQVFENKDETNWIGNAYIYINTCNMSCGNYTGLIVFNGSNGTSYSVKPCNKTLTITVEPNST